MKSEFEDGDWVAPREGFGTRFPQEGPSLNLPSFPSGTGRPLTDGHLGRVTKQVFTGINKYSRGRYCQELKHSEGRKLAHDPEL